MNRPDEIEEFCIFNRNQNACNYAVGMGTLAFLSCAAFLVLDIYFPQISSVKDRKKAVLADIGVSGKLWGVVSPRHQFRNSFSSPNPNLNHYWSKCKTDHRSASMDNFTPHRKNVVLACWCEFTAKKGVVLVEKLVMIRVWSVFGGTRFIWVLCEDSVQGWGGGCGLCLFAFLNS